MEQLTIIEQPDGSLRIEAAGQIFTGSYENLAGAACEFVSIPELSYIGEALKKFISKRRPELLQ